jgi:hypothetical protein
MRRYGVRRCGVRRCGDGENEIGMVTRPPPRGWSNRTHPELRTHQNYGLSGKTKPYSHITLARVISRFRQRTNDELSPSAASASVEYK